MSDEREIPECLTKTTKNAFAKAYAIHPCYRGFLLESLRATIWGIHILSALFYARDVLRSERFFPILVIPLDMIPLDISKERANRQRFSHDVQFEIPYLLLIKLTNIFANIRSRSRACDFLTKWRLLLIFCLLFFKKKKAKQKFAV